MSCFHIVSRTASRRSDPSIMYLEYVLGTMYVSFVGELPTGGLIERGAMSTLQTNRYHNYNYLTNCPPVSCVYLYLMFLPPGAHNIQMRTINSALN